MSCQGQVCWLMSLIPVLWRQKQVCLYEVQSSQCYTVRPHLRNKQANKQKDMRSSVQGLTSNTFLGLLSLAVINIMTNINLGRKDSFHHTACSPSSRKVRAGTQGYSPKAGTEALRRIHTCSACHFSPSRTTHPGVAPLTRGWALPHHHQSRKCSTESPTG